MRQFLRWFLFIFCVGFSSCAFAQSSAHPTPIGTVRFGIGRFYPPFIYNYSTGFDVALANALCQQMKMRCVFYNMSLTQLMTALSQNKIDTIIGALSITPARENLFNFTKPYVISAASFLGRSHEVYPQSLENLKVGVIANSTFEAFFALTPSLGVKVKAASTYGDLLTQLMDGDIDLILLDTPVGNYWVNQSNGALKLIGKPFQISFDQGFGIAVGKNNSPLLNRLNDGLTSLAANGVYTHLVQLYLAPQQGVAQVVVPAWMK